ncbi:MAG: hypothetical protein ACYDG2_12935 [Ruminiclostridium sp.]
MSVYERLWKDTMDIYQWVETVVDEVTTSVLSNSPAYTAVKCHYSKGSLTDIGTDGVPTLISSHTLFCPLGTAIEGDKVIVTQRNGGVITLTVGEGFPYSGGMQFSVKRSDTA